MTSKSETLLALDVGEKRIGVAQADSLVKIAHPVDTIDVDGDEIEQLRRWVKQLEPSAIVVGYPRNQSGDTTAQTVFVERFSEHLKALGKPVIFQDESVTSVVAEQRLQQHGKPYTKAMIDAEAAAIILQDYLELAYGH